MALQMQDGGLKYKYDVDEGIAISAPYGEGVALKCAVAIITLSIVIMALMIILYKGLGLSAALSSLLFILIEGWLLIGVPGIVLSMGGVIGIACATVLNAICMVILTQRVKEEYIGSKKTIKAAVKKGFEQALVPTISTCVVAVASGNGNLPCMSAQKYLRNGIKNNIPRTPPSIELRKISRKLTAISGYLAFKMYSAGRVKIAPATTIPLQEPID